MASNIRVGAGYDVHPLTQGRRLILGGVDIPFDRGLSGWSDADVLTHAIIDALLGAVAMGDIGQHFPPGDPRYKDISSLTLLENIRDKLGEDGWQMINIDATILAEQPKLAGFIDQMRQLLSQRLGIAPTQVSIKASTSNGLGFTGRGEGIAAHAVVLVERQEKQE
jgi:2-C-methyl-D-erythritol 2,4-cyclodiphosphate synthase